jgi:hypothetical protein
MSNGDQPAFPIVAATGDPRDGVYCANGFTKREVMAKDILSGMLASEHWAQNADGGDRNRAFRAAAADVAVLMADALLKALEKEAK